MSTEPPPNRWQLPDPARADEQGIAGIGADLEPGTLLAAYRAGLFPMRLGRRRGIAWGAPEPRRGIPIGGFPAGRSLHRARSRFVVTIDTEFVAVMRGCANPDRPHGWIDDSFVDAYSRLAELGWAHSLEVWEDG